MALEASVRLNDIIWVNWRCTCECISRPTFKLSVSLLDIMGISKEISLDLVVLHKSGSSWEQFPNAWRYHFHLYKKNVRKYKHHGTTQPSYRSGRRHVLPPRDERTLMRKVQFNPRTTAKALVKMMEETGTNRYYIHSKTSPIST